MSIRPSHFTLICYWRHDVMSLKMIKGPQTPMKGIGDINQIKSIYAHAKKSFNVAIKCSLYHPPPPPRTPFWIFLLIRLMGHTPMYSVPYRLIPVLRGCWLQLYVLKSHVNSHLPHPYLALSTSRSEMKNLK